MAGELKPLKVGDEVYIKALQRRGKPWHLDYLLVVGLGHVRPPLLFCKNCYFSWRPNVIGKPAHTPVKAMMAVKRAVRHYGLILVMSASGGFGCIRVLNQLTC